MEKRKAFAALDKNKWTIYCLLSVLKDLWFFYAFMLLLMIFWVVSLWEMIWIETIRMFPPTTISLHKLDCVLINHHHHPLFLQLTFFLSLFILLLTVEIFQFFTKNMCMCVINRFSGKVWLVFRIQNIWHLHEHPLKGMVSCEIQPQNRIVTSPHELALSVGRGGAVRVRISNLRF